jgi:hypothetical protein
MFLRSAKTGQTTQSINNNIGQSIIVSSFIEATGGTVTEDGDYKIHSFTSHQELLR